MNELFSGVKMFNNTFSFAKNQALSDTISDAS